MPIKLEELNLEDEPYEKHQIFYHGDTKIKAGSPKYYIEIFLMPYNIQASYKDLIRRQISMEFSRLLIVGVVFGRNNEFIEFADAEIFTLNIKTTTLVNPFH